MVGAADVMNTRPKTTVPACPCGSGQSYSLCCGVFIDNGEMPDTAERLMRSRYSAYVLTREVYLLRTWHESTRPVHIDFQEAAPVKWLSLKILNCKAGGVDDREGIVEFVARYQVNGRAERLQEVSRFLREAGQWLYVDGQVAPG